ncbi:MAG: SdrD B-like domain-containing protein, partial [Bacteroidia bacterium]
NCSGGTTPYTYSWFSGPNTATYSNLTAGSYSCDVQDNNGCSANTSAAVNAAPAPTITMSGTNVACKGASTGSATVTPSGGTTPYTYSWTPGTCTNATFNNLTAGLYTATVTDANGCNISNSVTITEPSTIMTVTASETDVSCYGGADGTVSVTASGGGSGYTYSWSPYGGNNPSVTALIANTFTCTVNDVYGCVMTGVTTVNQPAKFNLTPTNVDATCGINNGSASMAVTGGTAPYIYSWSPGTCTSSSFSNLAPGTYTCSITDNKGCTSSNNVTVNLISPPSLTMSEVNATCKGTASGNASVTVTGGAAPFNYSWSPNTCTTSGNNNIAAGNYTVTVTDGSGCSVSNTTTVTEPSTALNASITGTNVHCNGGNDGTAMATATGGTPGYTYLWAPCGSTTANISGVTAGTSTCTVTDANGCTYTGTITITQPSALAPASTTNPVTCNGLCDGVVSASASGGTVPYNYSWSPGGATSLTLAGQCPGIYSCFITDANGCVACTPAVTVTQPAALSNSVTNTNATCNGCDGSEASVATGGISPYTYLWSPGGQTTVSLSALCPGNYSVTVKDANGCTQNASGTITQSASPHITGTVIAPVSGAINSGWAYLVLYDSVLKRQHLVDSVVISAGRYTFTGSTGKKFLVYAVANHSTYPNTMKTYAGNADQWINATITSAPCGTFDTANIALIEITPPSGSGSFSGTVVQDAGYSPRMKPGNPIVLAPGDPIPGLDVNLEQHPGGIIAQTTTDNSGYYHFGSIPPGTFEVYVDVPGLGMISQYSRVITSSEMFPNLDYRVDSTHIYKDSLLVTSVTVPSGNPLLNSLSVSPNPCKDQLNIQYSLEAPGDVVFEIYSIIGEKVAAFNRPVSSGGSYSCQISASDFGFKEGVYTLRMTTAGIVYINRIVFIH